MARYRGFPWTIEQYLDLVESWPWAWYASWDQCVEPRSHRPESTCTSDWPRPAGCCPRCGCGHGIGPARPNACRAGWEVDHYRWSLDHLPLASWPKAAGRCSMCRRHARTERHPGDRGRSTVSCRTALDAPVSGKGTALRFLSDHPRIASVDSMALGLWARRQVPIGRTADKRIDVMHAWVRRNVPHSLNCRSAPRTAAVRRTQRRGLRRTSGMVGTGGGQPDRCGQRLAPLHEDLGRWVSATAMRRGRATRPGADPGTSGRTGTRCTVERRGLDLLRRGRTPSPDGHPGSSWTVRERL